MNKKDYDFTSIVDRHHLNSYKYATSQKDDDIVLTVADMDFECFRPIQEALVKEILTRPFGYTYLADDFYQSVSNFFQRHHNLDVNKDHIFLYSGVMEVIEVYIRTFTQKNDPILVFTPVYPNFFKTIERCQRRVVSCPLTCHDGYYQIDYKSFEETLIKEDVKVLLFCSPHNPVGRVWTKEELKEVLEICERHNVLIISDEIHWDFTRPNHPHTSLLSLNQNRVLLATSPTKSFNLAALMIAFMVVKDPILRKKVVAYQNSHYPIRVSYLAGRACQVAYDQGDQYLKDLNDQIDKNFLLLKDLLEKNIPKLSLTPLEGTYLAWMDLGSYGPANLWMDRLQQVGVYLHPGNRFGSEGENFVRINLATNEETIREFVRRLMICFT